MKVTKFTKSVIAILLSAAIVFTDGSIATAAETIEEIITSESIEAPVEEVIEVSEESPVSVEEILESLENNEEEILAEVEESNPEASLVETAEITDEENETLVEESEASVEENEEMLVEADGETSIEEAEIEDEETPAVSEVEIEETSTDIEEDEDAELEEAETVETENAEPVEEETEIEEEEELLPEIPLQTLFTYETDEVKVIVEASEEDTFPAGAQLVVEKLEVTGEIAAAVEAETAEDKVVEDIQAYDIRFEVTNEEGVPTEVEPKEGAIVQVQIFTKAPVEEATETEKEEVAAETTVFHFDEETNTIEDMAAETVAVDATVDEGEGLAFETNHFSTYLIVTTNRAPQGDTALNVNALVNVKAEGTWKQGGRNGNTTWDNGSYSYYYGMLRIRVYVDNELNKTYPDTSTYYRSYNSSVNTNTVKFTVSNPANNYSIEKVEFAKNDGKEKKTATNANKIFTVSDCSMKDNNYYYLDVYLTSPYVPTKVNQIYSNNGNNKTIGTINDLKEVLGSDVLKLSDLTPEKLTKITNANDPTDENSYELSSIKVGNVSNVRRLKYNGNVLQYNTSDGSWNSDGDWKNVGANTVTFYYKISDTTFATQMYGDRKLGTVMFSDISDLNSNNGLTNSTTNTKVTPITDENGIQYKLKEITVDDVTVYRLKYNNGKLQYRKTGNSSTNYDVGSSKVVFKYTMLTTSKATVYTDNVKTNSTVDLEKLANGDGTYSLNSKTYYLDYIEVIENGVAKKCEIVKENDVFYYVETDNVSNKVEIINQAVNAYYVSEKVIKTVDTRDIIDLTLFNYNTDKGQINSNFTFAANQSEWTNTAKYWDSNGFRSYTIRKDIVSNTLSNGYPTLNNGGRSLSEFFTTRTDGKVSDTAIKASHLFTYDEATGYYFFDSQTEKATLTSFGNNAEFKVTESNDNRFEPFKNSTKTNGDQNKYFFGMRMESTFYQPEGGQVNDEDMIFEFTGDDDVWIFIDGKLVLDLGGIHREAKGTINFKTGEIIQAPDVNSSKSGNNSPEKKYLKNIFGLSGNTFEDYSKHTIVMFYFERGAGDSNCKLKFNLPTVPTGKYTVQKKTTGKSDKEEANKEYSFKLYEENGTLVTTLPDSESYKSAIGGGTKSVITLASDGTFKLKANEQAVFSLTQGKNYYVVETDKGKASKVFINGKDTTETKKSQTCSASDTTIVEFKNFYDNTDKETEIVSLDKNAAVVNWDERTYKITLTACAKETTTEIIPKDDGEPDQKITIAAANGKITDVIDSRFKFVESYDGNVICHTENDGTQWIEINDALGTEVKDGTGKVTAINPKDYEFLVKAKDDFLGGNVIKTNGEASMTVGDDTENFPVPAVNVKSLGCEITDLATTIFIEDMITPTAYAEKLIGTVSADDAVKSNFLLSNAEISTLISTGSVTKCYDYAGDEVGTLTFTLEGWDDSANKLTPEFEDHIAKKAASPAETYKLTITYKPDEVAERPVTYSEGRFVGTPNSDATTASATFKVNVVEGTIVINKSIKSDDNLTKFYELDGDAIFTFKVTRAEDGMVYYKTLRFLKDDLGEVLSTTISHLPRGTYEVEELSTLGFRKASPDGNPNRKFEVTSDGKVVNELIASFVNERERRNDGRSELTHTDVLKNSFVMGEPISGYSMADNGTEYEANTGNTNNQNKNNDDTPKGHGDVLILTKND